MSAAAVPARRSVRFDAEVGVVGGGPAGALVAERLAALGVDVAMWDPKAPWEKPCGGGLTAAALAEHRELLMIGDRLHLVRRARLETTSGAAVEVPLEHPLGLVSRRELAQWQLARARAAGADVRHVAVRQLERLPAGGWRVTMRDGATHRVRQLVGADGAASLVRASAAPALPVMLEPTRLAFVPHAAAVPGDVLTVRFEAGVAGYAWDFPRRDLRSVGAMATPGCRTRAELDADVDRLRGAGEAGAGRPVVRAGAVIGTALHLRGPHYAAIGGADVALLGDAAGLADPATGEGLHNALRSAALAAEAFALHGSFQAYGRWAAGCFEPEFRIARLARRLLYRHSGAVRLIDWSARHATGRALLAALLNGASEHRTALLQPWLHALRHGATGGARSVPI